MREKNGLLTLRTLHSGDLLDCGTDPGSRIRRLSEFRYLESALSRSVSWPGRPGHTVAKSGWVSAERAEHINAAFAIAEPNT